MKRGLLIAFEGLDRSGKSTQCKLLCDYLNRMNGCKAVIQQFPGQLLLEELLTTILPKVQIQQQLKAIKDSILNHIHNGTHVLLDRYAYSGVAFTAAKGYDFDWCKNCETGLPQPDVVFYFDIEPNKIMERSGFGNEIYETKELQLKVRNMYSKFQNMYSTDENSIWKVISAEGIIADIHLDLLDHLSMFLKSNYLSDLKNLCAQYYLYCDSSISDEE